MEEPSAAKTDSSLLQKAFIEQCGTLEITPVDESGTDTSLLRFIDHLKKVVAKKDTALLFGLMSPDIVSSHGGLVIGKEEFIEHWHLKKDHAASELWPGMKHAMDLGGCFDKGSDRHEFVMPYLQAGHYFENGCDFDWFITYVCLGPETKIYEKPDKTSKVLAKLKFRMLESSYDAKPTGSFIPVHTIDRTVQGYVHEQDVYLYADYMLVILLENGHCMIKSFTPYD